jgi:hypothetical protein
MGEIGDRGFDGRIIPPEGWDPIRSRGKEPLPKQAGGWREADGLVNDFADEAGEREIRVEDTHFEAGLTCTRLKGMRSERRAIESGEGRDYDQRIPAADSRLNLPTEICLFHVENTVNSDQNANLESDGDRYRNGDSWSKRRSLNFGKLQVRELSLDFPGLRGAQFHAFPFEKADGVLQEHAL